MRRGTVGAIVWWWRGSAGDIRDWGLEISRTSPGILGGKMADPGSSVRHTFQSAAGATGNGTALDCAGLEVVACQVTGTFVGTVTWEGTVDGTNFVSVFARSM